MRLFTVCRRTFKQIILVVLCTASYLTACSQHNPYRVFAVKFASLKFKIPLTAIAVGSQSTDSTQVCYMVYLIEGNGKKILVDAGFTALPDMYNWQGMNYVRPDSMLITIGIQPGDITDIIVTHPHWDHIGGLALFNKATVWMQKEDFNYFVGTAWQNNGKSDDFNSNDVLTIIQKNIARKLVLVNGDSIEIIPGIKVFTGSKHSFESQYVLVESNNAKIIIASDNSWFYYNLSNLLPVPVTFDAKAYVQNLARMKAMVKNPDLIVPGHDPLVFSTFKERAKDIVEIK